MTGLHRGIVGVAAAGAAFGALLYWATADEDPSAQAAEVDTRVMSAPPAWTSHPLVQDVLERAKQDAKIEELPAQF